MRRWLASGQLRSLSVALGRGGSLPGAAAAAATDVLASALRLVASLQPVLEAASCGHCGAGAGGTAALGRHCLHTSAPAASAALAPAVGAVAAAAPPLPPGVQLVRDFIHDSLYHPTQGYFSKQTATGAAVVGSLPAPLDFRSFAGQAQYLQAVQAAYVQLQASWLTPVEIFHPHYARGIASCILQRWRALAAAAAAEGRPEPPLTVYEVGGGTGTLARGILDWLREEHPGAYARCTYACIEISPVLAAVQQQRVAQEAGHAGRFSVRQHDAADAAAWAAADAAAAAAAGGGGLPSAQPCFVVMCEVLDNLPHDRVWRDMGSAEWRQTLVAASDPYEELPGWHAQGGRYFELTAPVSDPLIARCLAALAATQRHEQPHGPGAGGLALAAARAWRKLVGDATADVRWLPTGCLQLLDTLHQARPSHTLIAADFDALPEVAVAGAYAPLVATTAGGTTVDHGTYLVPRGSADIFFPTDFALLAQLYRQAAAGAARQRRQRAHAASAQAAAEEGVAGLEAGADRGVEAAHMPTGDFMRQNCPDPGATACRDGYNPLLQDYSNSAFFLGSSSGSSGGGGGSSLGSGSLGRHSA